MLKSTTRRHYHLVSTHSSMVLMFQPWVRLYVLKKVNKLFQYIFLENKNVNACWLQSCSQMQSPRVTKRAVQNYTMIHQTFNNLKSSQRSSIRFKEFSHISTDPWVACVTRLSLTWRIWYCPPYWETLIFSEYRFQKERNW